MSTSTTIEQDNSNKFISTNYHNVNDVLYTLKFHPNNQTYYDYCEEYDSKKEYEKNIFKKDFGKGERAYQYELNIIIYKNTGFITGKYVGAKEILTSEELNKLIPYCRCKFHTASWYELPWCCYGRINSGCLESDLGYSSYVVRDTRKYLESIQKLN